MSMNYCDEYQPHAVRRIYDEYNQKHYDFRWDASGNLGQVSYGNGDALFESGRFMYWTEDSRMHAAVDDRYYSYYAYDHGGERRLKLTGDNKLLDVNADFMATYTILNEHTLYPSAYMVLTNRGYTKHYYAVAERVAARLGGGLNAMGNATGYSDTLLRKADTLIDQSLEQVNSRALNGNDIDCILGNGFAKEEFGHPIDGIPCQMQAGVDFFHDPFKDMVHSMLDDSHNGQEREVYFYHSDHLGSASWITDSGGQAIQHLQYLPYGEPYINQRTSGYSERFTFTGKEKDAETGYGYFGARYMDHELMTMWLSVDPMADKYPGISPYAYCAWNPVKLVDPDGMEMDDPPTKFKNIGPVIPQSDFIGWNHPGIEENCNAYAREQMSVAGYFVGGRADKTNINPYNEKTGSNEAEFNKAVDYIKSSLENGIPVFVGVDDREGFKNPDKTTDHFIVIVGMGYDEENGNYFTAYDNATGIEEAGTSDQNRLYVDYENKRIQSKGKFPNFYAIHDATRPYTVTQVRQSRKKKRSSTIID